jgi:hypothetical protein
MVKPHSWALSDWGGGSGPCPIFGLGLYPDIALQLREITENLI